MRAIVQRVKASSVTVGGQKVSSINNGVNVLIGISKDDTMEDIKYLKEKILNLRIFTDDEGKLNRSLLEVDGELLIVSQFTLYGDCRKGRRPNFMEALSGERAEEMYNEFVRLCRETVHKVETGIFGEDMTVSIENDGPVTLILDSKRVF